MIPLACSTALTKMQEIYQKGINTSKHSLSKHKSTAIDTVMGTNEGRYLLLRRESGLVVNYHSGESSAGLSAYEMSDTSIATSFAADGRYNFILRTASIDSQ